MDDRPLARVLTPLEAARQDRARLEWILTHTFDWELWRENRHLLPMRLYKAEKRGEVRRISVIVEYLPGMAEVYVRRLKPRPPRWRRPLILTGVAVGAGGLVLWMAWVIFQTLAVALAPALVILAVVWIIFHVVSGHEPECKGLHCPGCRR